MQVWQNEDESEDESSNESRNFLRMNYLLSLKIYIKNVLDDIIFNKIEDDVLSVQPLKEETALQWLQRMLEYTDTNGVFCEDKEIFVSIAKSFKQKGDWEQVPHAKLFGCILKQVIKCSKFNLLKIEPPGSYNCTLYQVKNSPRALFRPIKYKRVLQIAAGGAHFVFLTDDDSLYGFGSNTFGQMGQTYFHINTPLITPNNIIHIACGYSSTFLINNDFVAYAAGCNENGRLGIGKINGKYFNWNRLLGKKLKCIEAGSLFTCAIGIDDYLYTWGKWEYCAHYFDWHSRYGDIYYPKKVTVVGKILSISIGNGGYHCVAVGANGCVYTWGHNRVGQLGLEDNFKEKDNYILKRPTKLNFEACSIIYALAGWGNTLLIDKNNNILICGRNCSGQLGIHPSECLLNNRSTPCCCDFHVLDHFDESYTEIRLTQSGVILRSRNNTRLWGMVKETLCDNACDYIDDKHVHECMEDTKNIIYCLPSLSYIIIKE